MRSLATSDLPLARRASRVIQRVSSVARARAFLRVLRVVGAPPGVIAERVRDSPNFEGRRFAESERALRPRWRVQTSGLVAMMRVHGRGHPIAPVPVVPPTPPEEAGLLAVTWYGHASAVVEVDGARFLLDPVFGERASPSSRWGPRRMHPVPGRPRDLPPLDAVVVSHDHYDHLDEPTVRLLERTHEPRWVVPLGVDCHLEAWGVPTDRITALDWRESVEIGGVTLTCTEARHNSGRGIVDSQTLWAGWSLRGPHHAAYFAGDTGPSSRFERIGHELGPFDLTMLPIGAYDSFWPDLHLDPEQAVDTHLALTRSAPRGDAGPAVLLPVHWATFNLATHSWAEPIRRLRVAADEAGVLVVTPRLGERVDLTDGGPAAAVARHADPWWQACAAPDDASPEPPVRNSSVSPDAGTP